MHSLAENIITTILIARSITEEEKKVMLDKFSDESVSDEDLKAMLDKLCDAEIALREAENAELEQLRTENNAELGAEEARIAPVKARVEAEALAQEQKVADEYVKQVELLDEDFSVALDKIKRNEREAEEIRKIRGSLGITAPSGSEEEA